jgi:mono/diheme cytochrome c family protein
MRWPLKGVEMKRILKWVGIGVGGLVGLLVVLILVLVLLGTVLRVNKSYDIDVAAVEVPNDAESIARGKHFVESIAFCQECHGENLEGEVLEEDPVFGTFAPPNLTSGVGGVGGKLSNLDYVRAIRHGVGRDGKGLFIMPSNYYNEIGDEDLGAIIAYLKSLPPVDNEVELSLGPLARIISLIEEDFFTALRTGVNKLGKQLDPEYMPWDRLGKLTDAEISAIWLFVSALEPREFEQ